MLSRCGRARIRSAHAGASATPSEQVSSYCHRQGSRIPSRRVVAILGLLFLRAEAVPGFTQVDTQSQILVYAVLFGATQELLKRFIDQRSNTLVTAVTATQCDNSATETHAGDTP
jgi:hypothetical protein